MKCPYCSYQDSKVVDSRQINDGNTIKRRRECMNCQKRFTSYEKTEEIPIIVKKKNGARELFDKNKLRNGIIRACQKRDISLEKIDDIVDSIEREIMEKVEKEIESTKIGEITLNKLKEIDEVSYIRFASVYREFKDIETFMEELNKLIKEK